MVLSPRRRERGVALAITATSMLAVLAIAALVIDVGYMRQRARQEQGVADAAALAGAQDVPESTTPDAARSLAGRQAAFDYAQRALELTSGWTGPTCTGNLCTYTHPGESRVLTIESPCTTMCPAIGLTFATGAVADNYVYVEDCADTPRFLSSIFQNGHERVCRRAVARHIRTREGSGVGLISLSPTQSCAINVNGTNDITINAGAVIANSSSSTAICGTGGNSPWFIDTDVISTVGNVDPDVYTHTSGDVIVGQPAVADPFAGLPDSPCASTSGIAAAASPCSTVGGVLRPTTTGICGPTMSPGYFSIGCNLGGGNTSVDMAPGVYWFNGNFDVRNHDVTCSACNANQGVLLYFHAGTLDAGGNGRLNLFPYDENQPGGTSSTAGQLGYGGMTVYQRRGNSTQMEVGGTIGQGIGSIYAPDALIGMHGTPDRDIDGIVVGKAFDFDGTSTIVVTPPPDGPRLPAVVELALSA